jgi:hypothetical protein
MKYVKECLRGSTRNEDSVGFGAEISPPTGGGYTMAGGGLPSLLGIWTPVLDEAREML